MKLKCPKCGEIINYSMRLKYNRERLSSRGMYSFCESADKNAYLKRREINK